MCTTCETQICVIFDELVNSLMRDEPRIFRQVPAEAPTRPKYLIMELSDRSATEAIEGRFNDLVNASTGIGYSPGEFMHELGERSGYQEQVRNWARGKVPNGWVRKIILTRAEMMIRERGAAPEQTLLIAA